MRQDIDPRRMFIGLLTLAIETGCLVFFIVFAALSFKQFADTWKRSLLFAAFTIALVFPALIMGLVYLDTSRVGADLPPEFGSLAKVFIVFIALGVVLCQFVLRALYYHVAAVEWARLRSLPKPAIILGRIPWTGIAVGTVFGVVCALVSLIILARFNIGEGEEIRHWEKMFPGLQEAPAIFLLPAMLGFVVSVAIVEEMIFRGGLLGVLLRATKNKTGWAWLWIVLTSIPWAILHWENTDTPAFKLTQIFLAGIVLGALARKWGVLASIAGHVSLNVAVIVALMVMPFHIQPQQPSVDPPEPPDIGMTGVRPQPNAVAVRPGAAACVISPPSVTHASARSISTAHAAAPQTWPSPPP